jgi:hypothetical protein
LILANHTANMSNLVLVQKLTGQYPSIIDQVNNTDSDGRINLVGSITKRFIDGIRNNQQVFPNLHDGFRIQQLNDILLKQVSQ